MALTAVAEPVRVALGTGVAAELRVGLEVALVLDGENQGDVVVIDEGHEGVVLGHGEHGLAHQVDEAGLVGDVVDGGVDGDDDLAQLAALVVELRRGGGEGRGSERLSGYVGI